MSCLLVGYDLKRPGQSYDALYEAIKGLGSEWWHYMDSTWLIVSTLTPEQAFDRLKGSIDANDRLLIIDVKGDACYGWLDEEAWTWIQAHM